MATNLSQMWTAWQTLGCHLLLQSAGESGKDKEMEKKVEKKTHTFVVLHGESSRYCGYCKVLSVGGSIIPGGI